MDNDTKIGVGGLILLVFGVIAFFIVLDRLKIISLSVLLPGKMPFTNQFIQTPNPSAGLPIQIRCPGLISPCTGKDMLKNNKYAGIGFTVSDRYPVVAAIQGTITFRDRNASPSSIFNLPDDAYILGTGNAKGYVAVYDFVGEKIGKNLIANVSEGDPIASVSAGNLIDFQDSKGINLVFRLQDLKGNIIPLSSSNFK